MDLIVTSAKVAETLGIKSAELPVININEYVKPCTAAKGQQSTCDWADFTGLDAFAFNAYSYIKHGLTKVTVLARVEANEYVISGTTKIRIMYSVNGTDWSQFGSDISLGEVTTQYALKTFTDDILTALNQPFYVKIQGYIQVQASAEGLASLSIFIKEYQLAERFFRSQRSDI
jgi:hypothetical protein